MRPVRGLRLYGHRQGRLAARRAGPRRDLRGRRQRQGRRAAWPRRRDPLRLRARPVRMSRDDKACPRLRGRDPRAASGSEARDGSARAPPAPVVAALAAIGVAGRRLGCSRQPPRPGRRWSSRSWCSRAARPGRERCARPARRARVGRRRCAVGTGTPLAALLRSRPGRSGCATSAPVRGGAPRARGSSTCARSAATASAGAAAGSTRSGAGSAPPARPTPRGRSGAVGCAAVRRVTWFYCLLTRGSCQRTLELKAAPAIGGGVVTVTVRGYDDEGRGVAVGGATVSGSGCERGDRRATARHG